MLAARAAAVTAVVALAGLLALPPAAAAAPSYAAPSYAWAQFQSDLNGAGPPGSISVETPMTPGIPVGYPYLQFCLSAEPIVTLAITTFRESA